MYNMKQSGFKDRPKFTYVKPKIDPTKILHYTVLYNYSIHPYLVNLRPLKITMLYSAVFMDL